MRNIGEEILHDIVRALLWTAKKLFSGLSSLVNMMLEKRKEKES